MQKKSSGNNVCNGSWFFFPKILVGEHDIHRTGLVVCFCLETDLKGKLVVSATKIVTNAAPLQEMGLGDSCIVTDADGIEELEKNAQDPGIWNTQCLSLAHLHGEMPFSVCLCCLFVSLLIGSGSFFQSLLMQYCTQRNYILHHLLEIHRTSMLHHHTNATGKETFNYLGTTSMDAETTWWVRRTVFHDFHGWAGFHLFAPKDAMGMNFICSMYVLCIFLVLAHGEEAPTRFEGNNFYEVIIEFFLSKFSM